MTDTRLYDYSLTNRAQLILAKNKHFFFNVVDFTLPSLSLAPAAFNTPGLNAKLPGSRLDFPEPLTVRFALKEDFSNYVSVLDWISALGGQSWQVQSARNKGLRKEQVDLLIKDSHHNTVGKFGFEDAWPTSISPIDFDYRVADTTLHVFTVQFWYSRFVPSGFIDPNAGEQVFSDNSGSILEGPTGNGGVGNT